MCLYTDTSITPSHPSQLALDHSLRRSEMMEMTNVWAVRASNVPRAGDTGVPNPGRV